MSHTTLPTVLELGRLLQSAGMVATPPTAEQTIADYATAINAAADEWSRVTGYKPFLADAADVLRKFDPPGPTIRGTRYGYRARGGERFVEFAGTGLVSITSMTTGVDSVSTGTVRTLGTDFYLYPSEAAAEGIPWTHAEFVLPVWGSQQSVQVLGKWGFSATLPDDAWQAILFMAAVRLAPQLSSLLTGGQSQVKLGNDTFTFAAAGPFASTVAEWKHIIACAKANYVRL